jgi:hypothetical protein
MGDVLRWFPVVCACLAILATVYQSVMKWREVKTLKEIRDRLDAPR